MKSAQYCVMKVVRPVHSSEEARSVGSVESHVRCTAPAE